MTESRECTKPFGECILKGWGECANGCGYYKEPEIKADPQPCMYIGSTACTHPQENCGPWCVDYDELPF